MARWSSGPSSLYMAAKRNASRQGGATLFALPGPYFFTGVALFTVFATAFCFVVFWVFFGLLSPKCAPPQVELGRADTIVPRLACIDEPGTRIAVFTRRAAGPSMQRGGPAPSPGPCPPRSRSRGLSHRNRSPSASSCPTTAIRHMTIPCASSRCSNCSSVASFPPDREYPAVNAPPTLPATSPLSQRSPDWSNHSLSLPVTPLQLGEPSTIPSQSSRASGAASSTRFRMHSAPASMIPASTPSASRSVSPPRLS